MLTKQEMFDRAWRGLKAQGWARAHDGDGCLYFDPQSGRRCAWGHVDPALTEAANCQGDVYGLSSSPVKSLASTLASKDLDFAAKLQYAHDRGDERPMEEALRSLALDYGLTIPDEAL